MEYKEGLYTTIGDHEYKIIPTNKPGRIYVLLTYNSEAADDSFAYDERYKGYAKEVKRSFFKEVHEYRVAYYYKGYPVGKLGQNGGSITLFLDHSQQQLALRLGFAEHDRYEYIKQTDIAEVELVQKGPFDAMNRI